MNAKFLRYILIYTCFLMVAVSACAKTEKLEQINKSSEALTPTTEMSKPSIQVIDLLKVWHYQHLDLNDELSSKLLDRYLTDLDRSRSYFTQQDIAEFEKLRLRFDDDLKKGDLSSAYFIFNRYRQRMNERLKYMLSMLDKGLDKLDFEKYESLDLDREEAPWPQNKAELDDLWRKRLKNAVLVLRLADKTDEQINEKLTARFNNQLKRSDQFKEVDVFQIYMNAFTGMYDPHTQFFNPRTSENFNINMKLSLEGIGAVLQTEDIHTKVLRLVPAGPADNTGQLKATDRIVGVGQGANGDIVDVVGWRLDDVVDLIRGPKGSTVRLEILGANSNSDGVTKTVSIVRDTVKLAEQSAKKDIMEIDHDGQKIRVGVIDIPAFYSDFRAQQAGDPNYKSTTRDVRKLLEQLNQENIQGLIVDLRDNGGGSLQEAISLIGLFIKTGPTVQIRNSEGEIQVLGDRDPNITYSGPMAVMVNRMSASASEIFAGAIQDYQRGIVIGGQTFGKGTVQSLQPLGRAQLKLTQSKFYRITGASTQNRGIIPDIAFPEEYDLEDIGESALPNALPWDNIATVRYPKYGNTSKIIEQLRNRHAQRTAEMPAFGYLVDRRKYEDSLKQKTKFSLNESVRRIEKSQLDRTRLQLENKRRTSIGLEPLKSFSDTEEEDEVVAINTGIDRNDPLLTETAKVLGDYIRLEMPIVAKRQFLEEYGTQ